MGDGGRADVQEFTTDGTYVRSFGHGDGSDRSAWYVVADPQSEDVYVSLDMTVGRYDRDRHLVETIDPPFDQPICLDIDAAANLVIGGDVGPVNGGRPDSIVILATDGSVMHRIASSGDCPAITPDGSMLLVDRYGWRQIQAFDLR